MKYFLSQLYKAVILGSGILLAATAGAKAEPLHREVTLKDVAEVSSKKICLGDLVQEGWVKTRCAGQDNNCCRWSVGEGLSKTLDRTEIQKELPVAMFPGLVIDIAGASSITVKQIARELTAPEIQQRIVEKIAERFGVDEKNVSVSALKIHNAAIISLSNESDWDVVLPEVVNEQTLLRVVAPLNGNRVLGWVQPQLVISAPVYVARRNIGFGDEISINDFNIGKINLLSANAGAGAFFKEGEFPVGSRARSTIQRNRPLISTQIERTPVVKTGDTVTLVLKSDNLKVSTKGVAQSNGAVGEMINVHLSRYNRTFRGKIVDGRLVEVSL